MKIILFILSIIYLGLCYGQSETYVYVEEPLYIISENHVIYQDPNGRKIIYPDMETFETLDSRGNDFRGIALDKNGIYFKGVFLNVDTMGIEMVGRNNTYPANWLWKTETEVFKNAEKLRGIHAPTFTSIGCFNGGYFKDKNFIYFFDQKIDGSDGKTVNKTCDFELCYDKQNVYLKGEIMHFDGMEVKPVNDLLFKTKSAVIDRNYELLLDADPRTLRGLSRNYSIDKKHLYFKKDTCTIDSKNLEKVKVWDQVNSNYYTDGKSVYTANGYLQEELDAATFGMLPKSDFFYDKNGCYQRRWNPETQNSENKKFSFKYDSLLSPKNIKLTNFYIIFCNQAYSRHGKKIHYDLSPQELNKIKNGDLLTRDSIELSHPRAHIDDFEIFPNTPFKVNESSISIGEKVLISTNAIELLAIFQGYRRGCGSDPLRQTNFYFFKNIKGFWMVESNELIEPIFLGIVFDPKWNPTFFNFKLE